MPLSFLDPQEYTYNTTSEYTLKYAPNCTWCYTLNRQDISDLTWLYISLYASLYIIKRHSKLKVHAFEWCDRSGM